MNLLQAFGITEATDRLCKIAGIEIMDWQRLTDETIEEIGREDAKTFEIHGVRPSAIIMDEFEDTGEAKPASKYCNAC